MKKIMTALMTAALGVSLAGAAMAQQQGQQPGQQPGQGQQPSRRPPQEIMGGFNIQSLQVLLSEYGFQYQVRILPDNTNALNVMSPEGLRFMLIPSACNSGRCVAVRMIALFRANEAQPYDLNRMNAFNNTYAFIKAFKVGNDAAVSRYMTADYGVPRGNVIINIAAFEALARRLPSFLQQDPNQDQNPQVPNNGNSVATKLDAAFEPAESAESHEGDMSIVSHLFPGGSVDPDMFN